jgi:cobalamin biosynthesis protein CobT
VRSEGALVADGGASIKPGDELDIELRDVIVKAGVKHVEQKD